MPNSIRASTKQDGVYSVHYDTDNHASVIFQMTGSVWPKVLPYCLINSGLLLVLQLLKTHDIADFSISDKGHTMTTLFVSFLIISRVSMSLGRYNECRTCLTKIYREARELVQNMIIFTQADQSDQAKAYRLELAYQMSMLLRLVMAVIDFPTNKVPGWELPELRGKAKAYLLKNREIAVLARQSEEAANDHHKAEMNMRLPIQMGYFLGETIFAANEHIVRESSKLGPWQFGKVFGSLDGFMAAYYGIRRFQTTPFPFPLVQMARTFMFIYLYTLPFELLELDNDNLFVHMCIVFLVTFGFAGLETVSIEFDNPFGDDENDFDNLGMAYSALEDTYITIYNADGEASMKKLMDYFSTSSLRHSQFGFANGFSTEKTANGFSTEKTPLV